jgi:uncharacterized protein
MDDALRSKQEQLLTIVRDMGQVVVAFSGGVDSSYLLAAAVDALGTENVLAVTADSPLLPAGEMDTARAMAEQLAVAHLRVPFDELAIPEIAANPLRRCYYCKRARFGALLDLVAKESAGATLVHGENADDHLDYRPGSQAALELGVRAPLAEAGLTKAEIRILSRQRGLSTWDHPAASCLATRFPYDTALTAEGLRRVGQAERAIQEMSGIRQVRVRDHHPVARIEAPADQLVSLAQPPLNMQIVAALQALGYRYVTLDLTGYRMGSMNDGIAISPS